MTFLVKQLNLHFDKFAGNNECLKKKEQQWRKIFYNNEGESRLFRTQLTRDDNKTAVAKNFENTNLHLIINTQYLYKFGPEIDETLRE